jgi:hypothetical protein
LDRIKSPTDLTLSLNFKILQGSLVSLRHGCPYFPWHALLPLLADPATSSRPCQCMCMGAIEHRLLPPLTPPNTLSHSLGDANPRNISSSSRHCRLTRFATTSPPQQSPPPPNPQNGCVSTPSCSPIASSPQKPLK